MGLEPTTFCLGSRCSTTELRPLLVSIQKLNCRLSGEGRNPVFLHALNEDWFPSFDGMTVKFITTYTHRYRF